MCHKLSKVSKHEDETVFVIDYARHRTKRLGSVRSSQRTEDLGSPLALASFPSMSHLRLCGGRLTLDPVPALDPYLGCTFFTLI